MPEPNRPPQDDSTDRAVGRKPQEAGREQPQAHQPLSRPEQPNPNESARTGRTSEVHQDEVNKGHKPKT